MPLFLKLFLGKFLADLVQTFLALLAAARADDVRLLDEVRRLVADAEEKYGPGAGEQKARYVLVKAKSYALTLGKEIASTGVHALILVAMKQLGYA